MCMYIYPTYYVVGPRWHILYVTTVCMYIHINIIYIYTNIMNMNIVHRVLSQGALSHFPFDPFQWDANRISMAFSTTRENTSRII